MVLELPDNMSDKRHFLDIYGKFFLARFQVNGNSKKDIDNCILAHTSALYLIPQGHPDMPIQLSNLGNLFQSCFKHTGNLTDISEAISYHQKAVYLTSQGHANMSIWLNNLGISFWSRFQQTGDLTDISQAILSLQKAVYLTPQGHPDMSSPLNNLGISFQSRMEFHFKVALNSQKNLQIFLKPYHSFRKQWISHLRAM